MQHFDVKSLAQTEKLGSSLNFQKAVEPANRLIDLYKQLHIDVLGSLSFARIRTLRDQSINDYAIIKQILDFSAETSSPIGVRDGYISQLIAAYDTCFEVLFPTISYSIRKSTDFANLEREARVVTQSVRDQADTLKLEIDSRKKEAEDILIAIRKVAEEQGVSQQASYFKNEADIHETHATTWLKITIGMTVAIAIAAIASLFLHKASVLAPQNIYEASQLAIGKILVFATMSFFLLLAARNYSANRHNAVVNRHRQNALVTFEALVKAGGEKATRDIVLTKASECIFDPQPTAFTKSVAGDGSYSVINLASGAIKPTDT